MDSSKPDLRAFIDEINQRVLLSAIVGEKVKLRKKGHEFQGLCPFHNEKSPSFSVNDSKGFYHCFGCGAHGDALGFIKETQRLSFMESLALYAQRAGLSVPPMMQADIPGEKRGLKDRLRSLNVAAARLFRDHLRGAQGIEARNYLNQRGISDTSIKRFGLGVTPVHGELADCLANLGFSTEECVEAGLFISPQDTIRAPYPRFRSRLMFPIFDNQGRVIGFGGRTLRDDSAKYINCPETPLFLKGLNLYGMNFALKAPQKSRRILVAEGYFDVIQLHQHGFCESVAPMGTAITEDQLHLLWGRWEEIVVCMDGDKAGVMAANRTVEKALPYLNAHRRLHVMLLDTGDDPDTFLRKNGSESFRERYGNALPVSQFLWDLHTKNSPSPTPEQLSSLRTKLAGYAHNIRDNVTREEFSHYFKTMFSEHFRVPVRNFSRHVTTIPKKIPKMLINRLYVQECLLLRIVMLRPDILESVHKQLIEMPIHNEQIIGFRDTLIDYYEAHDDLSVLGDYLEHCRDRPLWSSIYDESLSVHHRFIHSDTPLEKLYTGWLELFALYKNLHSLQADLKIALNDLHNTMDPKAWERVKMLQEMAEGLRIDGSSDI
ncbi:MAG: DNA primase [Alphaproteobacteria bacterium]|nr:MAG: DNA primase [Alphaproteobacteria bacterium]